MQPPESRLGELHKGESLLDWVILDGFDRPSPVAEQISALLRSRLRQAGKRHEIFPLTRMDLKICRSCGACGYKSPGKCVVNDHLHGILRAVAPSQVLVFLSPIRFGGYSYPLKKTTEKFMTLGMPYYSVPGGRLMHALRYDAKSLLTIGVTEAEEAGQEECFRLLGRRNARNLQSRHHQTVIVRPADSVLTAVGPVLEEALQW